MWRVGSGASLRSHEAIGALTAGTPLHRGANETHAGQYTGRRIRDRPPRSVGGRMTQQEIRFPRRPFGPQLNEGDLRRMGKQRADVWACIINGAWWSLAELAERTGHPEASISASLRDFRKRQHGSHVIDRRRRYGPRFGTYEYRLGDDVVDYGDPDV